MATNEKYAASGDGLMTAADQQTLLDTMALPRKEFSRNWYDSPLNQRNNFGKVYNYFCPNDGTVSLLPIQGFGWRGVPQKQADSIPNLRQRVFSRTAVLVLRLMENRSVSLLREKVISFIPR